MSIKNVLFLLVIITIQRANAYREYNLRDLCHNNPLRIFLENFTDNTPTVSLDPDDTADRSAGGASIRQAITNSNMKRLSQCSFEVSVSGRNRGIFATVMKTKLRRNVTTGECIDYVQFRSASGGGHHGAHRDESARLCGDYEATGGFTTESQQFFRTDRSKFQTILRFDASQPLTKDEDKLELHIYFTAFRMDCRKPNNDEIACSPGICISRIFENDDIVNCPPQECADERKCVQQIPVQMVETISGTNIAISALTSLVLTMVGVLCIWMCCKYRYCSSSSAHGLASIETGGGVGSASRRRRSQPTNGGGATANQRIAESEFQTIDLPGGSSTAANDTRPSAPDEKDLPPSYESLFKKDIITH